MTKYTLSTQEKLKSSLEQLSEKCGFLSTENQSLTSKLSEAEEYITKLKKENRKRRLHIEDLQKRIDLGANSYYQCPYCDKTFINATFLQSHIGRRHPDKVTFVGDAIAYSHKLINDVNANLGKEKQEMIDKHNLLEAKLSQNRAEQEREFDLAKEKMAAEGLEREQLLKAKISELESKLSVQTNELEQKDFVYNKELLTIKEDMDRLRTEIANTKNHPVPMPSSPPRQRAQLKSTSFWK